MRTLIALFVALCFATIGCGPSLSHLPKTVDAKGVIKLDGKPVANAAITFISTSSNHHATAISDESGQFSLRAFQEKGGAVPGEYNIEINQTVVQGGADENPDGGEVAVSIQHGLPEKYASYLTSGLSFTIPDAGVTNIELDLSSK